MPQRRSYSIIGFSLAFLLYICILISLALYLQDKIKKNINYTVNKRSVLDVTLVERRVKKNKKHIKKIPKKAPKKREVATKPKPKKSAKKVQKKVSLKGIFKTIDTKKILEPKSEKVITSRKKIIKKSETLTKPAKKEIAKKVVESLSFKKIESLKYSRSGVYDKYKGEVQQILYENWQDTIDTVSGNSATVEIFIDKEGTFSYKIVKLSYNDEFNSKLVDFLEEMKEKEFPPFTEGEIFKLQVEFKDIRDD